MSLLELDENDGSMQENVLNEYQSLLDRAPVEAGKTKYYYDKLATTHEVIPLRHHLDVEKQSLHKVLQMIVKILKSGKSICIDDCNSAERTRASIIQSLTKEIPPLSLKSVLFAPVGGSLQVHWAAEWASAYWELKEFYDQSSSPSRPFPEKDLPNLFNAVEPYKAPNEFALKEFEKYAQPVHPNAEGFTSVDYIASQLYSLCKPFHRAALLIDACSVFYFQHLANENYYIESHFPAEAIRAALDEWLRLNTGPDKEPRIIFLVDERLLFPVVLEVDAANPAAQSERIASFVAEFKRALINLKLSHPIYFMCAQYGAFDDESFFSLPYSGMIAWVQHRHRLNLQSCYYLAPKPKVSKSGTVTENAIPTGLPMYLYSESFFEQTGWDMQSKLRKHAIEITQLPPFLKNIKFLGLLPEPQAPLQYGLSDSRTEYTTREEQAGFGRLHGCVIPPPSATAHAISDAPSINSPVANDKRRSRKLPQFIKSEEGKSRQLPQWMSSSSSASAALPPDSKHQPTEISPPPAKRRKVSEDSIEDDSSFDREHAHLQQAPSRQIVVKSDPFPLEMQRVPAPPPAPVPPSRPAPRMMDDHLFHNSLSADSDWVDTRPDQVRADPQTADAGVSRLNQDEDGQPEIAPSSPPAAITQSFGEEDDDDIFAHVNEDGPSKSQSSLLFKSQ